MTPLFNRLIAKLRSVPNMSGRIAVVLYLIVYMTVLCIVAFRGHQIGNFANETDFYWKHIPNAKDLIEGIFPDYGNKMPFYSFVLAPVYLAVGDWFTAGRLLSLFASALTLLFITGIVLNLTGRRWWAAFFAVVLVSSNHLFFRQGFQVGRDMLLTMLCMVSLFLCLKTTNRQGLLVAGILAALASLTRLNGLVLFPVLVFSAGQLSSWHLRRWMHFVWPSLLAGGGIFIAWPVVKFCATGSASLIIGKTCEGIFKTLDGAAISLETGFMTAVRLMISKWMHRFAVMMQQDISVVLGFPVTIVSVFVLIAASIKLRCRDLGSKLANIAVFATGSIIMLALYHYEERYSMSYLYWLPLTAVVCASMYLCKSKLRLLRIGLPLIALVLMTLNVFATVRSVKTELKSEPRYLLPFADYLRKNANSNDIVAAYKPHILAGSAVSWRRIPRDKVNIPEDMPRLAREVDAVFLLFSDVEMYAYPNAKSLLSATSTPVPGLVPVISTEHGVLYKVQPEVDK